MWADVGVIKKKRDKKVGSIDSEKRITFSTYKIISLFLQKIESTPKMALLESDISVK